MNGSFTEGAHTARSQPRPKPHPEAAASRHDWDMAEAADPDRSRLRPSHATGASKWENAPARIFLCMSFT